MQDRDYDLIIHNESHMDDLLAYFCHELRTVDGKINSANRLLTEMQR